MASQTVLDAAFRKAFSELLDQKHVKPNTHFEQLIACLDQHNHMYVVKHIDPKFFMTHQANRGGLLLSPHNVHRNGARIKLAGADLKQLSNAYCIELAASGTTRNEHIAKNKLLIERAGGLLAPLNGSERYVSIGCGHTVAFCKQAGVQGETSEKGLQLADSKIIDQQLLFTDPVLKLMVLEGWQWKVIPAIIDSEFPALAKVAQKALNTQNHISTEVGELETLMILASNAFDPGMQAIKNWEELAVENVRSLCMPCSPYANTLLDFVVKLGEGEGAPLIALADAVVKQIGCNVSLGQWF